MKVELLEEELPNIGSSLIERSPGLHLSSVIKDLNRTLGRSKDGCEWEKQTTWTVGLLWEEVLSAALADALAPRCGELLVDGIIMTPDGFDPELWRLAEYKLTWTSSRKDIVDRWDWLTQIKAYCRALDTFECMLHVLHVMGDYRGSGPQYRNYLLTFKQHELEENWIMIRNHARTMEGK